MVFEKIKQNNSMRKFPKLHIQQSTTQVQLRGGTNKQTNKREVSVEL
jgi:hypothetical protein